MPVPPVDVAPLVTGIGDERAAAHAIDTACRELGFFTIVGHGIDRGLRQRLDVLARAFFARPESEKAEIAMARGGRAWRGWFPVGGELTSGAPDRKEGIYFGAELPADDPRVVAGLPLHGPNLFPSQPTGLRGAVLEYLGALRALAPAVLAGMALGLGLPRDWFARELTADPVVLFRIFHYPPTGPAESSDAAWGVGEHTDYGLLTILMQDGTRGLQVRGPEGWIDVPPDPDVLVCNVGDMLELMTQGRYRSTPHRVRSPGTQDRLSFPYFFDPGWDAQVRAVPGIESDRAAAADTERWDGANIHALTGTYGEYLLGKVSKVFPDLGADVL